MSNASCPSWSSCWWTCWDSSIIILLLPFYAARFGASPLTVGLLSATYPMMQFLAAPVLGRLSDRFGRKKEA